MVVTKEEKRQDLRQRLAQVDDRQKKWLANRLNRTARTLGRWQEDHSWPGRDGEAALAAALDALEKTEQDGSHVSGASTADQYASYVIDHAHVARPPTALPGIASGRQPGASHFVLASDHTGQIIDQGNLSKQVAADHLQVPVITATVAQDNSTLSDITTGDLRQADHLPLPRYLLPPIQRPALLTVTGDSMAPTYPPHSMILLDLVPRPIETLVDRVIVLQANAEGLTLKLLREDEHRTQWLLVPLNTQYRVRILSKTANALDAHAVLGCVHFDLS